MRLSIHAQSGIRADVSTGKAEKLVGMIGAGCDGKRNRVRHPVAETETPGRMLNPARREKRDQTLAGCAASAFGLAASLFFDGARMA